MKPVASSLSHGTRRIEPDLFSRTLHDVRVCGGVQVEMSHGGRGKLTFCFAVGVARGASAAYARQVARSKIKVATKMSKLIGVFAIVACWLLPIPCGGTHDYSSPSASGRPHYERPRRKGEAYKERVVVFVHGIFGDADSTWRSSPTVYWPQLLTTDDAFQDSDVYVASYASPPFGNTMSLDEVVTNLNNRLVSDEVFSKHREIVFVCHSLGGLVVQRLLLTFRGYAQKVSFIYFFSTPETGAQIANVARIFSSDPLLKALLPGDDNDYLLNLENEWKAAAFHVHRFCAYEKKKYMGVLVVERLSGTRDCDDPPVAINEDHISIVKPSSVNHDSYIALRNAFTQYHMPAANPHAASGSGLPLAFHHGEIGILIAQARGDQSQDRQTAYQAAIMQMVQKVPDLKDVAKVRLLPRILAADLEQQHAEALAFGRSLHAAFVLRPNGVAGYEEPWITIVDQPSFSSSDAPMGTFATVELAQPDKLRLPQDVIQLARCTLALIFVHDKRYASAVGELEDVFASEAPQAAPGEAALRITYGGALLCMRRITAAEHAYRRAISLNPHSVEAHNDLGWVLSLEGNYEEGAQEARKAIEIEPTSAEAHTTLGGALCHSGRLDDGIAEYRLAIQYGDFLYAHENLANALAQKRLFDEAITELNHAIKLGPDVATTYMSLGAVWSSKRRWEKAIGYYRKAIELEPQESRWVPDGDTANGEPQTVSVLALAHLDLAIDLLKLAQEQNGSFQKAVTEYREAVRLAPRFAPAHYGLGDALGLAGAYEEAIAEFKSAIILKKDDAVAHHDLAVTLGRIGKFDDAISEYRVSLSLAPGDPKHHYDLGLALLQVNRYQDAVGEFQRLTELDPSYPDGYLKLCGALLGEGSPAADTKTACQRAVEIRPESPAAHDDLGVALTRAGQPEDAIVEYRKAVELEPTNATFHYNLGLALLAVPDRLQEARSEFAAAKRLDRNIQTPPF